MDADMNNKYNARKTEIDGYKFSSLAEGNRYVQLRLMLRAGMISQLTLQKKFFLRVNDQKICTYIADFFYWDIEKEEWITEDVKGIRTPVYRLKKKLMKAILDVDIVEVE